jgi:hypothetical protein
VKVQLKPEGFQPLISVEEEKEEEEGFGHGWGTPIPKPCEVKPVLNLKQNQC